jgi:plasmid stabilization system protein ParE
MSPRVRVHPEAASELREARLWYARRNRVAGDGFRAAYKLAIRRIAEAPERWAVYLFGTRRYLLDRFPYVVVYRIEPDGSVLVVAVAHQKRMEGYWAQR